MDMFLAQGHTPISVNIVIVQLGGEVYYFTETKKNIGS